MISVMAVMVQEKHKQIQRRDRLKVGKYSVDPYNTEYTGTHDHDEHGNQTLSKGSGSGNGAVHKKQKHHRKSP